MFPTCLLDQPRCLGLKNLLMLKKLLLSVYQRQVDTSGISVTGCKVKSYKEVYEEEWFPGYGDGKQVWQ